MMEKYEYWNLIAASHYKDHSSPNTLCIYHVNRKRWYRLFTGAMAAAGPAVFERTLKEKDEESH